MRFRTGFALLVALAAFTAACSGSDGVKTPNSMTTSTTSATKAATTETRKVDPNHIRAKDALGDVTTLDPCSLIDMNALPYHGTVADPVAYVNPPNLDSCDLFVPLTEKDSVDIVWGLLEGLDTVLARAKVRTENLGHGMRLMRYLDKPDECLQYLVFADDVTMEIQTYADDGRPGDLCGKAKMAANMIVASLLADHQGHRMVQQNALEHQDACQMLSADVAGSLSGSAGAKNDRDYPAHHYCHYEGRDALSSISLAFGVEPYHPEKGGTTVTIAGKPSRRYQSFEDGQSDCLLTTEHAVAAPNTAGTSRGEALQLYVILDGKTDVCGQAVKLAAKIWPKLPTA